MVDSSGDKRTVNNDELLIQSLKDKGLELHELIANIGSSRELSLALTKVEEAVMWAVKHITR